MTKKAAREPGNDIHTAMRCASDLFLAVTGLRSCQSTAAALALRAIAQAEPETAKHLATLVTLHKMGGSK